MESIRASRKGEKQLILWVLLGEGEGRSHLGKTGWSAAAGLGPALIQGRGFPSILGRANLILRLASFQC